MKKTMIFCIALIFTLILPTTIFAHTGLKDSSPSSKEVITTELKEITLNFKTTIGELSSFDILDASKQKVDSLKVTVQDKSMVGTLPEALPNGEYTVNWKILGEDGHVVKHSYSFTVKMPEVKQEDKTAKPDDTKQEAKQPEQVTPDKGSNPQDDTTSVTEPVKDDTKVADESSSSNMLLPVGIGAVVVLLLLVVYLMSRKNRRK
ncbi:copper resistance CopC family protein [Paenibacillus terrigena]|uniref:copper resistance CopC family protein n=1 Tax=Paenibacillus terrigena TaxID=369333 RepID=UPI0003661962|nr:copper resistance protein CopC [Paenibacillus terrigena]